VIDAFERVMSMRELKTIPAFREGLQITHIALLTLTVASAMLVNIPP
jgi:hypothetical protein